MQQPESAFDTYVRLADYHEQRERWDFARLAWLEAAGCAPDDETARMCENNIAMVDEYTSTMDSGRFDDETE